MLPGYLLNSSDVGDVIGQLCRADYNPRGPSAEAGAWTPSTNLTLVGAFRRG